MKKHEILLVDDDLEVLVVIDSALVDKGYRVTTASSGKAAIEVLSIKNFDLVITDLRMPEVAGIAVIEKAKELNPDRPVIIITGSRDMVSSVEALGLDVADYIFKPFSLSELWNRVAKCLERFEPELRQRRIVWRVLHQAKSSKHKEVGL